MQCAVLSLQGRMPTSPCAHVIKYPGDVSRMADASADTQMADVDAIGADGAHKG